ncbi:hypothetical protein [Baekduia sp. Peel2402]|uniref:hypothetical protein n=1 Tax=Baekduia sp. Peel2402 TaxID=3458296 RepID=UPI00403EE642
MFKKLRVASLATAVAFVVAAGIGGAAAQPASALTGNTWYCCSLGYVHPTLPWQVAPAAHPLQVVQADLNWYGCVDSIRVNGGNLQGGSCLYGQQTPAGGWVFGWYAAQYATSVVRPNGSWGTLTIAQEFW